MLEAIRDDLVSRGLDCATIFSDKHAEWFSISISKFEIYGNVMRWFDHPEILAVTKTNDNIVMFIHLDDPNGLDLLYNLLGFKLKDTLPQELIPEHQNGLSISCQ